MYVRNQRMDFFVIEMMGGAVNNMISSWVGHCVFNLIQGAIG